MAESQAFSGRFQPNCVLGKNEARRQSWIANHWIHRCIIASSAWIIWATLHLIAGVRNNKADGSQTSSSSASASGAFSSIAFIIPLPAHNQAYIRSHLQGEISMVSSKTVLASFEIQMLHPKRQLLQTSLYMSGRIYSAELAKKLLRIQILGSELRYYFRISLISAPCTEGPDQGNQRKAQSQCMGKSSNFI